MYRGHVTDKKTGKPMPGLCVSDGLNIAVTDENGAFALSGWERAHVIAVQCLTQAHDDWFAMIDGHEGAFEFAITPAAAPADHNFLHISDSEISFPEECENFLPFIKTLVCQHKPAFLIHTGDICRIQGLENHRLTMNFDTLGCPVRYTLGNHDYVDDRYGEYSFERMYGPVWYSFDLGNTHYVVLPIKGGEAPGCYLPEDADRWLYNDLQHKDPDKSLVLFCHTHCHDEDGFTYHVDDTTFCLRDYGLLAWVFGHYHINFCSDLGGYYNICTSRPDCGGIDSSPTGIRKIEICGNNLPHRLKTELFYNDLSKADPPSAARWETRLPGRVIFADPLLDNHRLYVSTADNGHPCDCGLFCLDAETGRLLWSYKTYAALKNVPALSDNHKIIYAQDSFGWVYALHAETGDLCWKTQVLLHWAHHAENGVLAADGRLFCGCGRMVTALSCEDGSLLWRATSDGSEDSPARFAYAKTASGGILLAARQWRYLYALDAETGEELWRMPTPRNFSGTPLISGDEILLHAGTKLFRLSLLTGKILQEVTPEPECCFNTACAFAERNGVLYTATANRGLAALDAETLLPIRFYDCAPTLVPMAPYRFHDDHECESLPVFSQNKLLFAAADGYLHICDTESAVEIQKLSLGAPCYVTPVLYGDTVITADFSGAVRAFPLL